MTVEPTEGLSRDQRLNEILAQYFQAAETGRLPDKDAFIARHPDHAAELEPFLADRERLERLAKIFRLAKDEAPKPDDAATQAHRADEPTLISGSDHRPAPPLGTKVRYFGDYELLEEIARGGMGVVYKARQVSMNRVVALKMILAGELASEADIRRFHTEAEAAANLQHPHIVAIHEVGEYEGQHYFSMDYVEGRSLSDLIADGPVPADKAAAYVQAVASAVHYAHQHDILHRDLKPPNVLVDRSDRPRITDFGLAKRIEGDSDLTVSGTVLGTPGYMAPEQAAGKGGEVGVTSDVYSTGAILYELLTGRPPFRGDTAMETLVQVLETEPEPPRRLNREVPRDLETICLKCMAREPRQRYESAQALADDLGRYLQGEAILARPLGVIGRLVRWARRQPALATVWLALVLFYALHLVCLFVLKLPGEGGTFHIFVTHMAALWGLGAWAFQLLMHRPKQGSVVLYGWASMDVLMFTFFLLAAAGPSSAMVTVYLLLVAAAGLRFRIALVWFMAGLCTVSYLVLVFDAHWYRPQHLTPPHAPFYILVSLAIMGLIMHLVLRRVRLTVPTDDEPVCHPVRDHGRPV